MKKLPVVLFALLLGATSLKAQTETVANKPKKLQQLYLSFGTGPAVTPDQSSQPFGGTYSGSLTAGLSNGYIFRAGVQYSVFTAKQVQAPGVLDYISHGAYNTTFYAYGKSKSITASIGKSRKLHPLFQVNALAGVSFNALTRYSYIEPAVADLIFCSLPEEYFKPGVVLQAEAMFLPTRFAGLTLGGYYHFVPEFSNGGLTLNLNLGKLKN